jgi:hypothetical protein
MKKIILVLACTLSTPVFAYDNYHNPHNSYQYNKNRAYQQCYRQAQRGHGRVDQNYLRRCMNNRGFRY